ncbi:NAD-dependent epimerase/dehydratase family protein [Sinorhizobium sp. BG8]|uniref:dTDP-glucose 4,6-dehydratase n=1 Tax=Sinorhizobium sp. BG8 TaxID=2613773 RepID=UPI00193C91A9|nr:NAD-dependent epimerase/dehydratase family protein [Sinorhizobium sp. BG8]QRM54514.1 NAD-dependent epimerase/dehydratase family protein [Sinorhizobium sp. BG8]
MSSLDLSSIRTIVVTGGAGFVGSHVVDDLLRTCPQAQIRVVDAFTSTGLMSNLDAAFLTGRVMLRQGDVGNLDLMTEVMRDADLVVHAAGESSLERSYTAPERFSLSNAIGTQVVVEAMARTRVPLMIHMSSVEVYGSGAVTALSEQAALRPDNPRGGSKAAAEMLIAGLCQSYGLDIRVLRPVNIVGTRQNVDRLVPRFVEFALVGKPLTIHGDGMQRRGFVTVSDFCAALRTVVSRGMRNAVYNVASGEDHAVLDVAQMVLDHLPGSGSEIVFSGGRAQNVSHPEIDASALEALGWKATGRLASALPAIASWHRGRMPAAARQAVAAVPELAPRSVRAVVQPAGSGLFRSLERH